MPGPNQRTVAAIALWIGLFAAACLAQEVVSPDELVAGDALRGRDEVATRSRRPIVRGSAGRVDRIRRPVRQAGDEPDDIPMLPRRRPLPVGPRLSADLGDVPVGPLPIPAAAAGPKVFSLPELIASTVEKNFEIKAQKHSINASHRALQFAKAQQLPLATLHSEFRDTNFWKRFRDLNFGEETARTFGDIFDCHALLTGITVNVPMYYGDKLAAFPRAARVRESIEIVKREKVQQDVLLKVVSIYADLLLEEKRAELYRLRIARREEDQKALTGRIKNPDQLKQQLLSGELDLDELRQEALQVENALVGLREQLARASGLPRGVPFSLKPEIGMKDLDVKLEEAIKESLRTNPGIVLKTKTVDLANEELAIRNGKDHTTLDLRFDYDHHLTMRTGAQDADVWLASLVFAWDVYDGGRNLSEQREGKEKREQVIAELEVASQELEVQVRQAHHMYEESRKQATGADRWVQTAREHLRSVQDKVDTGALLAVDLLDAKIQYQRALVGRDRLVGLTVKARARLYNLLGQLSPAIFQ